MASNPIVSNSAADSYPAIPVRAIEKSSNQTQVFALDVGGAGAESLLSGSNPLPTTLSKTALTGSSPTSATIGATSTAAVAANSSRKGLVLINTSENIISLAFGSAAVLNSGITLYPRGSFQMDEYTFSTQAVNAIASVASSNLAIQEYT